MVLVSRCAGPPQVGQVVLTQLSMRGQRRLAGAGRRVALDVGQTSPAARASGTGDRAVRSGSG